VQDLEPEADQKKLSRSDHVRITFSNGQQIAIPADKLRSILGYENMRSTTFKVAHESGHWRLSGAGFGHGVGLCQAGARTMAKQAYSGEKIVVRYYPQSQIIRIN
jgi:stage II sporulation protein D